MANMQKWYGSKDKAIDAVLQSDGNKDDLKLQQDKTTKIDNQFTAAQEINNCELVAK